MFIPFKFSKTLFCFLFLTGLTLGKLTDGYTHLLENVIINDKIRQTKLESAGFKVVRFRDEEVLREIDFVKNKIMGTIKELESK